MRWKRLKITVTENELGFLLLFGHYKITSITHAFMMDLLNNGDILTARQYVKGVGTKQIPPSL